ncbi:hypothetical protein H0H81_007238 [Sphagnurus paluster]|uniref:Uncharacterized protein n=1 Tax=Sphagnurus paluster TaxID=117069 RepID=A0A9P7FRE1_9AGAR|nr:hypothetical protein H0H81_007238 [Sphagnurus paluster]
MKSESAVASLIHPGNNVSLDSAITSGKVLVLDDSPEVSIKKGKKKAVTKATKPSDVKYVNTNAPTIKPYEEWDSHEELNKEIDKHLICYVRDQMARKKSQEENPDSIQPETRVQLPPGLRKMIREVRGVAPNAATTTRELALHILTSSHLNTKCLHHGFDRRAKPSSTVIGNQSDPATLAAGLLNCGCNEEDALWDFFFWKTTKGSGDLPFEKHSLTNTLRPYVKNFSAEYGLKLDDHYTWNINSKDIDAICTEIIPYNSPRHKLTIAQRTIDSLTAKIKKINATVKDGMEFIAYIEGIDPSVISASFPSGSK